ncbi:tripartite motif-containing protein 14-like [Bombina bombina]|uniref:tripartite motif-containing protein 14-like n=1 Tax=Bombina bombina TaxID=8345 RepID=UPI00235B27A4|nr:tripartite motif-containing protein 14-like [Bombina bombina]
MAAKYFSGELHCSVCLNICTDLEMLNCGHNFCQVCFVTVQGTLDETGSYACPLCRTRFISRPVLQSNSRQCNIMHFPDTYSEPEGAGIVCTYCVHFPVRAAKTCLLCEASLCDIHVSVHNKSEEHFLTEPTNSFKSRKCYIHNRLLEYYCSEDNVCICVSCTLVGDHKGHQLEMLTVASEKKIEELQNVMEKLSSKKEETDKWMRSLQEHNRDIEENVSDVTKVVLSMIVDIRAQMKILEKHVLSEISRQREQVLFHVSDMINQLQKEKDKLSSMMSYIAKLCNTTDPLTVLQEHESQKTDFCDAETADIQVTHRKDNHFPAGCYLDQCLISATLYRGLADILTDKTKNRGFCVTNNTDMSLDINTASNDVAVSGDLKTASWSVINQQRPEGPERFQGYQVLSSRSFSLGHQYFELEASQLGIWMIGMSYACIKRKGNESIIGCNRHSWCLRRSNEYLSVVHDSEVIRLPNSSTCQRLGILLDYEAGCLSFYQLHDQLRHLHTFNVTFTEPLHAVVCVNYKSWVRIMS